VPLGEAVGRPGVGDDDLGVAAQADGVGAISVTVSSASQVAGAAKEKSGTPWARAPFTARPAAAAPTTSTRARTRSAMNRV
jgi:hypothetical protein